MHDDGSENGELPEGWATATIPQLIGDGGVFSDGDWVESKDQDPSGGVRLIQLADVGDSEYRNRSARFLTDAKAAELNCTFLKAGDILVARMPEPLGRACVFPGDEKPSVTVVDVCILRPATSGVERRWLLHTINSPQFRWSISDYELGTTRKRISRTNLGRIAIPVPPLPEQQRIVAKVEALLARVNATRQRLAKAPAILKRFRQSVLAAACSGRLTADWREQNTLSPAQTLIAKIAQSRSPSQVSEQRLINDRIAGSDEFVGTWALTTVGFLAEPTMRGKPYITSGSRGWADFVAREGPYFIRSENINSEYLRLDDAIRVKPPPGPEAERTRVCAHDLLLTITGNNVGRTAIVPNECPTAHVSQHVAIIRTTRSSDVRYLWIWLRSIEHGQKQLQGHFYGYTKPGLNLDQVKSTWVALPPAAEQLEIVRRVEALFKLADAIEKRVAAATARADKLTQAILAKAFRGELVPTEAELARREGRDYEPASVLLERIKDHAGASAPTMTAKKSRGKQAKTRLKPYE